MGLSARSSTADLLKGLAVILMIQVHAVEQLGSQEFLRSNLGQLSLLLGGPACAPVFMAVMGYFLASSKRPLNYFIKRGLIIFLLGIILNIGRSANLLLQIVSHKSDLNPWCYIFGADILTLAGLGIVISGFLLNISTIKWYIPALLALLVSAASEFIPEFSGPHSFYLYLMAFIAGGQPWSYFPMFPWLAYILAGIAFGLFHHQVPSFNNFRQTTPFIGILVLVFAAVAITSPWAGTVIRNLTGPSGYYHHGFLFFIWTAGFLAIYTVLAEILANSLPEIQILSFLQWSGKNVTLFYLIQWLMVGNLAGSFFQTFGFPMILVIILILTIFTSLIVYGLRRFIKN